jgi:hypothetical protein
MTEFFYLIRGYSHSIELLGLTDHHDVMQIFLTSSERVSSFVRVR